MLGKGQNRQQRREHRKSDHGPDLARVLPPGCELLPKKGDDDAGCKTTQVRSPVDPWDKEGERHIDEKDGPELIEHGAACR